MFKTISGCNLQILECGIRLVIRPCVPDKDVETFWQQFCGFCRCILNRFNSSKIELQDSSPLLRILTDECLQFCSLAGVSSCCYDIVLRVFELEDSRRMLVASAWKFGINLTSSPTKASPSPRELPVTK